MRGWFRNEDSFQVAVWGICGMHQLKKGVSREGVGVMFSCYLKCCRC